MSKPNTVPSTMRSLKLGKTTDDAAFDSAQIYARHHGRKAFGVSSMLRMWIESAKTIYCAKTLDEAHQAAKILFESNPRGGKK